MDALAPFRIPAASLKADEAAYDWSLGSDFLALFDEMHEGIDGQFTVRLGLFRTGGINTADFVVEGNIRTNCDRCSVPIMMPVEGEFQLIIKYGDPEDSSDDVIYVDPDIQVLEVGKFIYEFILLSVPIGHHIPGCEKLENPPCDFTILHYLQKNIDEQQKDDDDSPWGDLKKAIDN